MVFHHKKYVTFDCYGTLIDWEGGITHALRSLAERNGYPLKLEGISDRYIKAELAVQAEQYRRYHEVLQLAASRLLQSEGITLPEADALEFADSIYHWQPFPETHQALAALQAKGYQLIILSNIDNEIIERSIKLMGLTFAGVVTAQEVGSYKPAHGHWLEMLRRFSAEKDEVLHVAASYVHDIIPAKTQGFDTIWINRNHEQPTTDIRPDIEMPDLTALPDAVA